MRARRARPRSTYAARRSKPHRRRPSPKATSTRITALSKLTPSSRRTTRDCGVDEQQTLYVPVASEAAKKPGHNRIGSTYGAGGMGEVYLAEDTRLPRRVALKLLSVEFTKDAERVKRFEQEARAASA